MQVMTRLCVPGRIPRTARAALASPDTFLPVSRPRPPLRMFVTGMCADPEAFALAVKIFADRYRCLCVCTCMWILDPGSDKKAEGSHVVALPMCRTSRLAHSL